MEDATFNVVRGCGRHNKTIYRINDVCRIGRNHYSKEEAIEAITEEYSGVDRDNYIAKIEELYSNDCDVEALPRIFKDRLLMMASRYGRLEVVKYLVSIGAGATGCDSLAVQLVGEHGEKEMAGYINPRTQEKG